MRSAAFRLFATPGATDVVSEAEAASPSSSTFTVFSKANGGALGARREESDTSLRRVVSRAYASPRPVTISQIHHAPRVSVAAVRIDGSVCEGVCFCARVVRCRMNDTSKAGVSECNAVLLVSDNTGLLPVLHYDTAAGGRCEQGLCRTYAVCQRAGGPEYGTPHDPIPEANLENDEDHRQPAIAENDYVFVVGRFAFADISKDARRAVKGMEDFISAPADTPASSNALPTSASWNRLCVRGRARLVTDMNEIHYWILSALETHLRLLSRQSNTHYNVQPPMVATPGAAYAKSHTPH
ncbi:hypothetical protein ERJ75_000381600 [Trypanosoma vivax]|nr:hypothetical protein TRVL_05670 [Trypanosoma vivax]KAH8617378.1 hypothetical protein ERJ75_000381600 [Trypanosoma vivax]